MLLARGLECVGCKELANNPAPFTTRSIRSHAEGFNRLMSVAGHAFAGRTRQHIGEIGRTKPLPCPIHSRKRLLRIHRAII